MFANSITLLRTLREIFENFWKLLFYKILEFLQKSLKFFPKFEWNFLTLFHFFPSQNRFTVKLENSSNHLRLNSCPDSPSSSQLAVTPAHQTLTELSLNRPLMLNNVKTHWKASSLKEPRLSSKNDHWTWTWPALHVALLEPSLKKSSHQSAQWSQKPVARRRSSWNPSCQSSVWLNWSSLPWPSSPSSELHWSLRKLWSSPSSPSFCRNSCSSRNCCQREVRAKVVHPEVFWMLSTASEPTASLLSPSPTLDTSNTKSKSTLASDRKKIFEFLVWKKQKRTV